MIKAVYFQPFHNSFGCYFICKDMKGTVVPLRPEINNHPDVFKEVDCGVVVSQSLGGATFVVTTFHGKGKKRLYNDVAWFNKDKYAILFAKALEGSNVVFE